MSRATYAANAPSEDCSTVVVGKDYIFAGVWDGHGGPSAARFTQQHVWQAFSHARSRRGMNVNRAFATAFATTDRAYYAHVQQKLHDKRNKDNKDAVVNPALYFAGTCAIACWIDATTSRITCANLGDSRAVAGRYQDDGTLETVALSTDHAAASPAEQARIRASHPGDDKVLIDTTAADDFKSGAIAAQLLQRVFDLVSLQVQQDLGC